MLSTIGYSGVWICRLAADSFGSELRRLIGTAESAVLFGISGADAE